MFKGYIKLHRQLLDCEIWLDDNNEPFDRRSAWIDLLLLANHQDKQIIFDGKPMTISRGQYMTSVRKLSERWGWSKDKTLRYLNLLEELQMIEKKSDSRKTVLTVVKYEVFQNAQDTNKDTHKDTDKDSGMDTHKDTDKPQTINVKNIKNEKNNKYNVCFEEFWKCYPRKKEKQRAYEQYKARLNCGYSEEELLTACKRYAEECKGREERYIKHGATFLSANEPFADYLKGEQHDTVRDRNREVEEQISQLNLDDDGNFWDSMQDM